MERNKRRRKNAKTSKWAYIIETDLMKMEAMDPDYIPYFPEFHLLNKEVDETEKLSFVVGDFFGYMQDYYGNFRVFDRKSLSI